MRGSPNRIDRRDFLLRTGLAVSALGLRLRPAEAAPAPATGDWGAVRALFNLKPGWIHLAGFFLASHPKPVRDAIDRYRKGLDEDPVGFWEANIEKAEADVRGSAAEYLGVRAQDVALTDSTTMGLGLLYGAIRLRPGQELLCTEHDHYSTQQAHALRAARDGTPTRMFRLYSDPATVTEQEIVGAVQKALSPKTRVLAVTWVHSSTGVRLPIRAIADVVATANARRAQADRVLLCVDGVHGLAAAETTLPEMGCDFFVAGCHKWLFGPRGTGIVWGKPDAWPAAAPVIPPFDMLNYPIWQKKLPPQTVPACFTMSPGGFHSFEHRFALSEAFRLHARLGKQKVAERIRELNGQLKAGLRAMSHVTLYTPMDEKLSAGIVCFDVKGMKPQEVVERLHAKKIIASVTPYAREYARLACGLFNTPAEVDTTLREIRALA
jgi:selenocysteine lyase/cysteine desulfurase